MSSHQPTILPVDKTPIHQKRENLQPVCPSTSLHTQQRRQLRVHRPSHLRLRLVKVAFIVPMQCRRATKHSLLGLVPRRSCTTHQLDHTNKKNEERDNPPTNNGAFGCHPTSLTNVPTSSLNRFPHLLLLPTPAPAAPVDPLTSILAASVASKFHTYTPPSKLPLYTYLESVLPGGEKWHRISVHLTRCPRNVTSELSCGCGNHRAASS